VGDGDTIPYVLRRPLELVLLPTPYVMESPSGMIFVALATIGPSACADCTASPGSAPSALQETMNDDAISGHSLFMFVPFWSGRRSVAQRLSRAAR